VTHESERRYDSERTLALETCSFHVIRVSNTDVYNNLDGVLELIAATLPEVCPPLTRLLRSRPLPGGER
jgi:very-short-patch-repair endonuclease